MSTSLEDALNTVNQLTPEQQAMLVEIIHNRLIEASRRKIAEDARASIAAFHAGELQPQSAPTIIAELQSLFNESQ
ncbi:hypothetical protein GS597_15315 [Synechococcales cyanobacterium C]|uniref:Uncharacterized protein n=1 Tax=Petrachloros mirabilis ULC683 TaxID=2781853 RepID=A0A8K2A8C1_9CYAN|nr:hypothetical protein [Petrachloros mirabilis]NCJ07851.1 hypothetical protein [Petrachloros mirabilis ULC683]